VICITLEDLVIWIIGGYLLTCTAALLYVIWRLHRFLEDDGEIQLRKRNG